MVSGSGVGRVMGHHQKWVFGEAFITRYALCSICFDGTWEQNMGQGTETSVIAPYG